MKRGIFDVEAAVECIDYILNQDDELEDVSFRWHCVKNLA